MGSLLCISIRFLQPYLHGRDHNGDPEWPPSPLRVMQALVAASAGRWNERRRLVYAAPAIQWLEKQPPPRIVAARAVPCEQPYRLYVPDNVADKVAASWSRGRDASIADYRIEKDVRPVHLDGELLHYLYPLSASPSDWRESVDVLAAAARSITHFGWGIDMAIGDARVIDDSEADSLIGERWCPVTRGRGGLRIPIYGTLEDLARRHETFLNRMTPHGPVPAPPLRTFGTAEYRRVSDLPDRPFAAFILRPLDGDRPYAAFRPERAVCVAAMLRHATCQVARNDLEPGGWRTDEWARRFVAGHGPAGSPKRRAKDDAAPRFSYLPLPSIGHAHAGGGIRRVLIAEPWAGDGRSARWAAQRLAGEVLEDEERGPVARLEPIEPDETDFGKVFRLYAPRSEREAAAVWTSVTPVILPGYDDNKPAKRERLLLECLRHAGIEPGAVACIESRRSAWIGTIAAPLSAFKRPTYLKHLPALHIRLTFRQPVRGPIAIGAGRHCGLGVCAVESRS